MQLNSLFFLLLSTTLLIYGCSSDDSPEPDPPLDPAAYTFSEECDQDSIYFVNQVLPIMVTYCANSGCHNPVSSEASLNFTTYLGISVGNRVVHGNPLQSQIYQRMTSTNPNLKMPPDGYAAPDERQIELIRKWIEQGGRNNECAESCSTEGITYTGRVREIIADYCAGCHGGIAPEGGLVLQTYEQVKAIGESGALVGTIRRHTGFIPMPLYGSMTDCKVDQIVAWVNDGMPE
ncbi:MAG: hypothetical protein EA362_01300 [Saprospirales bacterium]|nr:MAG: hypothetical protein EA362_01300 [Saprospirales bacterium]